MTIYHWLYLGVSIIAYGVASNALAVRIKRNEAWQAVAIFLAAVWPVMIAMRLIELALFFVALCVAWVRARSK